MSGGDGVGWWLVLYVWLWWVVCVEDSLFNRTKRIFFKELPGNIKKCQLISSELGSFEYSGLSFTLVEL